MINACDRANYHDLQPRPTLGIVSGLRNCLPTMFDFELILRLRRSLIETGGYLIYTAMRGIHNWK